MDHIFDYHITYPNGNGIDPDFDWDVGSDGQIEESVRNSYPDNDPSIYHYETKTFYSQDGSIVYTQKTGTKYNEIVTSEIDWGGDGTVEEKMSYEHTRDRGIIETREVYSQQGDFIFSTQTSNDPNSNLKNTILEVNKDVHLEISNSEDQTNRMFTDRNGKLLYSEQMQSNSEGYVLSKDINGDKKFNISTSRKSEDGLTTEKTSVYDKFGLLYNENCTRSNNQGWNAELDWSGNGVIDKTYYISGLIKQ